MTYNGQTRIKERFTREVLGDSIGAYFSYHFEKPTTVELRVGVSYVSIENARKNLEAEIANLSFEQLYAQTRQKWNDLLKIVQIKGGSLSERTVFYTGLYHALIHPNILNDVDGSFPTANGQIGHTDTQRYTVFSLWDTYRNYHQLMTLLYPKQQLDMVRSMLQIYEESGWLPKWELNSTETFTMVGDPASIVLADTY